MAVYKAWQSSKVRRKHEAIEEAHKESTTVQFATLMDMCFLMDNTFQKHKGLVVLRGDAVKDDSGSCAVFTEQGSSASHMIAVKVFDVISRLSDCAGGASDVVSADTRGKQGRCSKMVKITGRKMPSNLDTPKLQIMGQYDNSYHWKETCKGIHWQGCCGNENSQTYC